MDAAYLTPSGPVDDPLIGTVLQDRYRIVRRLGEGGMGAVYEGEHVLIKRRVAIKCLHAEHARNAEVVARFHREALAATAAGNEHIIEVTDMGRFPDGAVFLVLEYLDGRDVSVALEQDGAMPLGRAVRIAMQVCDALVAAHAKGIVHRDLKPENVFLIQRGDDPDFVKVLDFGISKFRDAAENTSSLTRTGAAMGTPYYMAPEQLEGRRDVDQRVDVYALGVMLFRMLTGRHPFEDATFAMLVVRICTQPPPPVRTLRPDVPVEVEDIVQRMLAKNRDERFTDCAQIKAALRPYASVDRAPVVGDGASLPDVPAYAHAARSAIRPRTSATSSEAPAPVVPSVRPGTLILGGPPGSKRALIVAGGIVCGLIAAGLVLPRWLHHAPPPPSPEAVLARPHDAPPPETVVHDLSAALAPAPSAATIHVRIQTEPAAAVLLLDNERVSNPFEGELPQSSTARRIEARLAGYTTEIEDLVVRYPQNISIAMHRGHGVEDHRRAPAAGVALPQQPREPTPTPGVPVVVAPPAAEPMHVAPALVPSAPPPEHHAEPLPLPTPTPTPELHAPPAAPGTPGVVAPPPAQRLHGI